MGGGGCEEDGASTGSFITSEERLAPRPLLALPPPRVRLPSARLPLAMSLPLGEAPRRRCGCIHAGDLNL